MILHHTPRSVAHLAALSSDESSQSSSPNICSLHGRRQPGIAAASFASTDDGRIVGPDGFVVPRDFPEFFERFPRHVRSFVRRHLTTRPEHERQERESELLLFLLTLPEDSKYRRPGVNGHPDGCTDRIMTFCPERSYGASAGRFFAYLNLILLNRLISLEKKSAVDPVASRSTLRFTSADIPEPGGLDEASYLQHSSFAHSQTWLESEKVVAQVCVSRFFDFVQEHNPELIPTLNAIASSSRLVEAQTELGISDQLFSRGRHRLRVLHRSFTSGTAVPKQRRNRTQTHATQGTVGRAKRVTIS